MCTSIAMKTNDFYFGRTMDLEYMTAPLFFLKYCHIQKYGNLLLRWTIRDINVKIPKFGEIRT